MFPMTTILEVVVDVCLLSSGARGPKANPHYMVPLSPSVCLQTAPAYRIAEIN